MTVQVIRDHDATCAGADFLRVYCQRRAGSPATFATIERVFGGEIRTRTWHFRMPSARSSSNPICSKDIWPAR